MRWQSRFLNDELWLRSRRLLLSCLREMGLDSPYEAYQRFVVEQHAVGIVLRGRLKHWLGAERVAEIGAETFLDAGHRRFELRLPFILAFPTEYLRWLELVAPAPPSVRERVRELAALFNLGIVLVDQVVDEPDLRGHLATIFSRVTLPRLLQDPAAAAELRAAAGSLATPELRVLGSLVAAFFEGVAGITHRDVSDRIRSDFAQAITRAYEGQLAAADARATEAALRSKSALPFVVPPALLLLSGARQDGVPLLELGMHVGEFFWRVDDILDLPRDFAASDGNIVLLRAGLAGSSDEASLDALLRGTELTGLLAEAAEHASAALSLLDAHGAVRGEAARWLEMYTIDWMR